MDLRPYQQEFVDATFTSWETHRNVLGVCATGGGKTIIAADIMRRAEGNCLFIADAVELVTQNAAKFYAHTGEFPGVEMANEKANHFRRVIVASTQTLFRRVGRYAPNHFSTIIIDEAHRNTLGGMSQAILGHFQGAKILGMTATPFRSDRKLLSDVYDHVAIDIPLERLIAEGWLANIAIKSVPLGVHLEHIKTVAGDYSLDQLGDAIEPHLLQAAQLLKLHASDRKSVVFLPLVRTSVRFAEICRAIGLRAVHVDGENKDALAEFATGDAQVICNASLLSTGWDCPQVDCVLILRPTKSLSLYMQMVGRGTRPHPGKKNLLLLDPLFLSDDHTLIKPARLIARDEEQAAALAARLEARGEGEEEGEEMDLMQVDRDVSADRERKLQEVAESKVTRNTREVDAMAFALSLDAPAITEYVAEFNWEKMPPTEAQITMLTRQGFDIGSVINKGHASKIIDLLSIRRNRGLATPKQVKWLVQMSHPEPSLATFEEASKFLDEQFSRKRPSSRKSEPVERPTTPREFSVAGRGAKLPSAPHVAHEDSYSIDEDDIPF